MKTALKIALKGVLFSLLFCSVSASAQRVYFSKSVSDEGDPVGLNQFFYVTQEGITIAVLVKLPYQIEATQIDLRFFKLDSLNNELYLSTVPFDVETTWTWFWKGVNFNEPARYKVYAYADKERFLCSEIMDLYTKQ
ncbi:MAG: hypothetical protein POELPBGB_02357 [Bacteroidia bacterium]|nr:hypothetical protein [Bacteroidia bacterium]